MTNVLPIHGDNPQSRRITEVIKILRDGGIVVYPTDSCYALGCQIGNKAALDRIRQIRALDAKHNFTLVCRDLSEISTYAQVDNAAYRLMRTLTPGPYTFILKATGDVPRRLQHPKRKTIGLRVPDNAIARALLAELGEPIMSTTLLLPDAPLPLTDPEEMRTALNGRVSLVIDGGHCGIEPTTVVDLVDGKPLVTRAGRGKAEID